MKRNHIAIIGILSLIALLGAFIYIGCGGGGGSSSGSSGSNGNTGAWSFLKIDSPGVTGWDSSIAVDTNNKVHISYNDATNGDLKYATNISGSWAITTVDSAGDVGEYTSIGVDSNNKAHIAYLDYTNYDLKYATNASGIWVTTTIDNVGWVGEYASLAVDSNNKIHVGYYDYSNHDLKYATNASGSWATTIVDGTIDAWYDAGRYSSIDVDTNNKIHISYQGTTDVSHQATLKYATNASGIWVINTVDNDVNVGEPSAIAVDSNNKAHISYYRYVYNDGDLKYATNASGSWVITTVDSAGNTGFFTSIATDSYDHAHINYIDLTNWHLKYATNASGAWITSTLATGLSSEETSLAIDDMDNLHVSYCKNDDLEYAKYTAVPTGPAKVTSPSPAHAATYISTTPQLSWAQAKRAVSYDVYFGTTNPPVLADNLAVTSYSPGTLNYTTTYYWRIDSRNSTGATTGDIWSFTTRNQGPIKAGSPLPASGATDIQLNQTLGWSASADATSYDVCFGTTNPPAFQSNTASLTYNPGALSNNTVYYWRIDPKNAEGTTTGDLWQFSTIGWEQKIAAGAAGSPISRSGQTMVWDGTQAIMFGGFAGTYQNDLWWYNPVTNTWTQKITNGTAGSPISRSNHSMVWDGTRVIMFGGGYNDLWWYEPISNTWTEKIAAGAAGSPISRSGQAMVWDGTQAIMFGGDAGGMIKNDLWWYDPITNTWTQKIASGAGGSPPVRYYHSMVWDGTNVIMFGGLGSGIGNFKNDLWWYNPISNTWTQKIAQDAIGSPISRSTPAMIWDGARAIMFGGGSRNDLWWYNPVSNTWIMKIDTGITGSPPTQNSHSMIWNGARAIIFGGSDGVADRNDLWWYNPLIP